MKRMTAAEWEACQDAEAMLECWGDRISDRKRLLLGCASYALAHGGLEECRAVEFYQRAADGRASLEEADPALPFGFFAPISNDQVLQAPADYRVRRLREIAADCVRAAHDGAAETAFRLWWNKHWKNVEKDFAAAENEYRGPGACEYFHEMAEPRIESAWVILVRNFGWNKLRNTPEFSWDEVNDVAWAVIFEKQWNALQWHTSWPVYFELLCQEDGSFEYEWDLAMSAAQTRGWYEGGNWVPPDKILKHRERESSVLPLEWSDLLNRLEEVAAGVERKLQAALLRHFAGNPFQQIEIPDKWPSEVIELAAQIDNGIDCARELGNALRANGDAYAPFADHFLRRQHDDLKRSLAIGNRIDDSKHWHPKGCYFVDLILGKQ